MELTGPIFPVFQWQHGRLEAQPMKNTFSRQILLTLFPWAHYPLMVLKTGDPFQPLAAGSCINRR